MGQGFSIELDYQGHETCNIQEHNYKVTAYFFKILFWT